MVENWRKPQCMQVCPFQCTDMGIYKLHKNLLCGVNCILNCCQFRSFIFTPSDGSITNIWLVQNGTKCENNKVHMTLFYRAE